MKRSGLLALAVLATMWLQACNPGDDEGGDLAADLSGVNEVCEGDTCGGEGTGTAEVEINSDRNRLCYQITLERVEKVTAAHIHTGEDGRAGPVLIDLKYQGDDSGGEGCVDGIGESTLEDVSQEPANFYLNVHSEGYPDGAVRGQLED